MEINTPDTGSWCYQASDEDQSANLIVAVDFRSYMGWHWRILASVSKGGVFLFSR